MFHNGTCQPTLEFANVPPQSNVWNRQGQPPTLHLNGRNDEFGTLKNQEDHHQTIGMKDGHHAKDGWCI